MVYTAAANALPAPGSPEQAAAAAPPAAADPENPGGQGAAGNGTSLTFTPYTLAFRRIKYHVPKPAGKVRLGRQWQGQGGCCLVLRRGGDF